MIANAKLCPKVLKKILFASLVASSPSMAAAGDPPLWVRGATDVPFEFAVSDSAGSTVVLIDARDVYLGKDMEEKCQDGNEKLGIGQDQQFCSRPEVKKVWIAPNRVSILKNNLGYAAVDAQPAQINGGYGLLVNMKIRMGVREDSYAYLKQAFPAASLQRLRAQSVTFDLLQQNIETGFKVKVNPGALLADGDESTVQLEFTPKGLSVLRCNLRLRDAIKKFGATMHDGVDVGNVGADFFTFIAGAYKPTYKVLQSAEMFNGEAAYNSQWTYGYSELEIVKGSLMDTAKEDVGLFLIDDSVPFGTLSTSAQAARLIENAAKVLGDINAKDFKCPLISADAETSYAKEAIEALKANPIAWEYYLSTFKKVDGT